MYFRDQPELAPLNPFPSMWETRMTTNRIERLESQVRWLRRYAAGTSAAVLLLATAGFVASAQTRFTEIEVERINVMEPDGRHALVIANSERLPGVIIRGEEYPREVSSGRERSSGIIYFNHEGTEAGGLAYGSESIDDEVSAGGGLTVDRMNQDQVISMQYGEHGGRSMAALQVWDRPSEHMEGTLELVMAHQAGDIDREEFQQRVAQEVEGIAHRLVVGSVNRTALVQLNDSQSRPRIRISVDTLDVPALEFLDADGEVVLTIPED